MAIFCHFAVENRQDLQDFSGFNSMRKILRNPVNPVYVHYSSFRINLKCPNPALPGDEPEKMYG
jgi:hypothetical protein